MFNTKSIKIRYILAFISTVLALVIAFVVLPKIYEREQLTTTVIKTTRTIPPGEQITSADLREVEVGVVGLPSGVIVNKADVDGKYALTTIYSQDILFSDKITSTKQTASKGFILEEDQVLISVSLGSSASGVSKFITTGSVVDVMCYIPEQAIRNSDGMSGKIEPAHVKYLPLLRDITVYSIENTKLITLDQEIDPDSVTDITPAVATLIVTTEQAEMLTLFEYTGKIHLIWRK